jgi:hypothetical protein
MKRPLHILLLSVVLASCMPSSETGGSTTSSLPSPEVVLMTTYNDPAGMFTMLYPRGWSIETSKRLHTGREQLMGTAFLPPVRDYEGTKLLDGMIHMAFSQGKCRPYSDDSKQIVLGENTFEQSEWSGVGTGNMYTGDVYQMQRHSQCVTVTLYQHGCNLGPDCGLDKRKEFSDVNWQNFTRLVAKNLHFTMIQREDL